MLKIRGKQMRVLADESFVRRLAVRLRKTHSKLPVILLAGVTTVGQIPEPRLLEMVRTGVARARSYGLTDETSLATFVFLMFFVAPNFDEHPLIARVLADARIRPDSRVDELWEKIGDGNFEAARRNYSPGAWEAS
jgi:hypothetical protein